MNNYISIKQILDNLLAHPMLQNLSFERAINYAVQFIRLVGMPNEFIEKTEEIHIDNYRASLPCDYNEMIQVRLKDKHHHHHGHFHGREYFRYTTDSFHLSDINDKHHSHNLTYKVQGGCIFTSIKEGDIEIAYRAIPVDNEGYPLIVDNSAFMRALELYIKKECFTILFDMDKINRYVLQNTQQEYAFAVGQAQSSLVKLNIDQMEAFTNMINTLVPRVTEHNDGFVNLGTRERIKVK